MKHQVLIPVFLALLADHLHSLSDVLTHAAAYALPDETIAVNEESTAGDTSSHTYRAFRQLVTQKDPKCSANSKCKDRGLTGNWYARS
jgi:hypothetical protein